MGTASKHKNWIKRVLEDKELFRHQVSLVCECRVRSRQAAKKQSGPGLRRET